MPSLGPAWRLGAAAAGAALLLAGAALLAGRPVPQRPAGEAAPPELSRGALPRAPEPARPPRPRSGGGALADARSSEAGEPATPPADRVTRKALRSALGASGLPARLAACLDAPGGLGGGAATDRVPTPRPAVLALDVESVPGAFHITVVRVHRWGEASQRSVACAAERLRGTIIRSPAARAGQRTRLILALTRGPPGGRPAAGVAALE